MCAMGVNESVNRKRHIDPGYIAASAKQCWSPIPAQPAHSPPSQTNPNTTYPTHLFRLLLLRRLWLPLPLTARRCRFPSHFCPFGGHPVACPQAGSLRGRGVALERAAATICREAGARVTTHTRVADLNIDQLHRHDDRRTEVTANGLSLWGGAH